MLCILGIFFRAGAREFICSYGGWKKTPKIPKTPTFDGRQLPALRFVQYATGSDLEPYRRVVRIDAKHAVSGAFQRLTKRTFASGLVLTTDEHVGIRLGDEGKQI